MLKEITVRVGTGGNSQAVAISGTSAQSAAIQSDVAVLYATTDCFMRAGSSPTALSDGTDQFLPALTWTRVSIPTVGWKIAFKTTAASGTVYITPGA